MTAGIETERDAMGLGHKGTTKSGGQKDPLDRFYTAADEADRIVREISPSLPRLVIEPSAGRGAFVLALENASVDTLAYDIDPDPSPVCSTPIVTADFLTLREADLLAVRPDYSRSTTAFVGNPPFGVQGRLAVMFLRHCLELADDAWMILPPSFRKTSMADKVGNGELVDVMELESTTYSTPVGDVEVPSFLMHWHACDGKAARMRRRQAEQDAMRSLPFEFLPWDKVANANDNGMFTIRRVGGTSGRASADTGVSSQSNYLCRVRDGYDRDSVMAWVNATDFPERDWSVGPRSLSKGEIALRLMASPI